LGAKLSKIVAFASAFYVSEHKIDKKQVNISQNGKLNINFVTQL
jgi:hypothetical protein